MVDLVPGQLQGASGVYEVVEGPSNTDTPWSMNISDGIGIGD